MPTELLRLRLQDVYFMKIQNNIATAQRGGGNLIWEILEQRVSWISQPQKAQGQRRAF